MRFIFSELWNIYFLDIVLWQTYMHANAIELNLYAYPSIVLHHKSEIHKNKNICLIILPLNYQVLVLFSDVLTGIWSLLIANHISNIFQIGTIAIFWRLWITGYSKWDGKLCFTILKILFVITASTTNRS